MSELNNDLNEQIEEEIDDADVITVPIDDTLSNSGEAADAKAVGDALALKADKSELSAAITVNGQGADAQGAILVDGTEIQMSSSDQTTIKAAIEAVDDKTAEDIKVATGSSQTIKQALDSSVSRTADQIPMASGSETTISQKIGAMDVTIGANSSAISALQSKTGDTIPLTSESTETIAEAMAERVKTVNGEGPDDSGNVQVQHALTADNLTSSSSQNSIGEWTRRTSGGTASISDGSAWLSGIRGNRTHVGYVPEALNMSVTTAPREEGETPITATIDRDAFVAAASGSGTYNFVYTTSWDTDPSNYGITVTGDPVSGDQITVIYTAEDRGTIIQSDPQSMVSVGANLFDPDVGYAIGLKYSNQYGFAIKGTYTAVKYSSTPSGTKTTLSPADGLFDIPANGYIWVEGSSTDTMVFMTWADWILSTDWPDYEAYSADEIDLSDVMEDYFPYGLLRVGDIRDEIDFNTGMAISNVERLTYSAENLATAIASGRAYEYDTNYIYLERAAAVSHDIELDGQYAVSDHGLEYFTGTDISVYAIIIYGNNLKNKLERDVVTKSQDVVTGFTSTATDKALSASAGKTLYDHIAQLITVVTDTLNLGALASGASSYASKQITVPTGYKCIGIMAGDTHVGIVNGNILFNCTVSETGMVYINYRTYAALSASDTTIQFTVICIKSNP